MCAYMRDVFAIYDNILPRLIMIIIKIIFPYFIEIAHTDFPSTGTRLVYIMGNGRRIRVAKATQYSEQIELHRGNISKTWKILNKLIGKNHDKTTLTFSISLISKLKIN